MSNNNHINLFKIESFKQRKRLNFLILLSGILFTILWIIDEADGKYKLWETILMRGPLVNAFIIPVVISVYAARQMDLEHKGDTWKLLYTFVSPRSLFFVKIIRCSVQIFISLMLQTVSLVLTGIYFDYQGKVPVMHFAWLFLCDFLVTEILFLIQSLLSFFFSNQAVSICAGLAGGFIGFFLTFFPNLALLRRLLPCGLFLNTCTVFMDWDENTKIASFYFVDFPLAELIACIIWLVTLLVLCLVLSEYGNTDERSLCFLKQQNKVQPEYASKRKRHHFSAELLKMRQLPIWLTLVTLPAASAFMGTFNYLGNKSVFSSEWLSLWSQHTLFLNYLFMPVVIGVFASGIWHVEHTGSNWNRLLVNASASRIVMEKYAVMILYNALAIIWTGFLFVFCGKFVCGFTERLPLEIFEWILCGFLGAACISGFQLLVSLIIRNFVIPVGVSFLGAVAGLLFTASFSQPYLLPYSLLAVGMRSNNPKYEINYTAFFASCIIQLFLWAGLCIFYINHTDVRSNEN